MTTANSEQPDNAPVAWITGASAGIGQALAIELARRGYDLILSARRAEKLAEVAGEIEALGRRAAVCPADVSDADSVLAVPAAAAEILGHDRMELCVANAGVICYGRVQKLDMAEVDRLVDVNIKGVIYTVRAAVEAMLVYDNGLVSAVSSLAGMAPLPKRAAYAASKAFVRHYMQSVRLELRGCGVTASTILPGYVQSDMIADVKSKLPFVWTAERAARRIANGLERREREIAFPWPLVTAIRLGNMFPAALKESLLAKQEVDRPEG